MSSEAVEVTLANEAPYVMYIRSMQHGLAAELKTRNVPEQKWEAIGKALHGKPKNQLSRVIASV